MLYILGKRLNVLSQLTEVQIGGPSNDQFAEIRASLVAGLDRKLPYDGFSYVLETVPLPWAAGDTGGLSYTMRMLHKITVVGKGASSTP